MSESCARGSVEHLGGDGHVTLPIAFPLPHTLRTHLSPELCLKYVGGASGGALCGYCSMAVEREGWLKHVWNIRSMSLNFL